MPTPERVLVPIDFSRYSRRALDWALSYATARGAEVFLLHVFDPPPPLIPVQEELSRRVEEGLVEMEHEVLDELHKLFRDRVTEGLPAHVHRHFATGNPAHEIVSAAHSLTIDLIVMGSRGRTGLEHFLVGSVAERVLRRAQCSVVVASAVGASIAESNAAFANSRSS